VLVISSSLTALVDVAAAEVVEAVFFTGASSSDVEAVAVALAGVVLVISSSLTALVVEAEFVFLTVRSSAASKTLALVVVPSFVFSNSTGFAAVDAFCAGASMIVTVVVSFLAGAASEDDGAACDFVVAPAAGSA